MARGQRSAASIIRGEKAGDGLTKRQRAGRANALAGQMRTLEIALDQLPIKNQAVVLAVKGQLLQSAQDAARYLGRVVNGAEPVDKTADRIRACSIVLDAAGILQQSQQTATDGKEINELSRAELMALARDGLRMLAKAGESERDTVEGEIVSSD